MLAEVLLRLVTVPEVNVPSVVPVRVVMLADVPDSVVMLDEVAIKVVTVADDEARFVRFAELAVSNVT
jgi:hypothetical protein